MKRRKFDREFKLEAVRRLKQQSEPVVELARSLGVPRNRLYKWRHEVDQKGEAAAFRGSGRKSGQTQELSEIDRLKKRIAELETENDILKKAEAYFADHPE